MPITENGYEYTMPEEWLSKIDLEFLTAFRDELFKMNYISLDGCYCDTLAHLESTTGYHVAFKLACVKSNKLDLYQYSKTLPWYDSDIFDGKLSQLLIKNKLIIDGYIEDIIGEKLGIDPSEIEMCMKCGKYFFKKDMIPDKDAEDFYYCIHCEGTFDSHQYYLEGLNLKIEGDVE